MQVDRPGRRPEVDEGEAEKAQDAALRPAVADIPVDGQCLLVQLDGPAGLPQGGVAEPR